jgi:predicted RNA-binding protein (virulence factor B family)
MIEIGKINKLKILRRTDKEIILDGEEEGELHVPEREIPLDAITGDEIEVFIYRNAQRKAVATGIFPYVLAGEFDFLTVNETSEAGALLDWGLSRDLFLPAREQKMRVRPDNSYLVYVYYDLNSRQIIATTRVERFIGNMKPEYVMNQEVELLFVRETEIGYRVIVDNAHWGMVYRSEIFQPVNYGLRTKGYVKQVREDGKIDVSLQKQGYKIVDELGELILEKLQENGGFLPVNDKTGSDEINNLFACSKKSFKKTIGALYREHRILIEEEGIRLQ